MTEIAFAFPTTALSMGLLWPQAGLVSATTGLRQTLLLGYPRWQGTVTIDTQDRGELQTWLARMARGDNWSPIPLNRAKALPDGAHMTVMSQDASTGVVRVTISPELVLLRERPAPGFYITDGKRVRQVSDIAPVGGTTWDMALTPVGQPVEMDDEFREATAIDAYVADANVLYVTHSPDWIEPVTVQWIERVLP